MLAAAAGVVAGINATAGLVAAPPAAVTVEN